MLNEIKQTIQWVENHAKALTALVIFLPIISFYHYSVEEKIQINITGLSFLTKAPAIFSIICLIVIISIFMSLNPIFLPIIEMTLEDSKGIFKFKSKSIILFFSVIFLLQ